MSDKDNKSIEFIRGSELEEALSLGYRQYLTGHLSIPQPHLKHIDADIEVGTSVYREFTADKPHVHPVCTEYNCVLSGAVRLLDISAGEEHEFCAGDFWVLRPGTPYATKNAAGTRVLFIKAPSENDKMLVEVDEGLRRWLSCWEAHYGCEPEDKPAGEPEGSTTDEPEGELTDEPAGGLGREAE